MYHESRAGAGCATLIANREIMSAQGMDTTVFDAKPQCNAPACNKTQGDVWKPASSPDTMTCQQNLNICTQNITQGVAKNAPVNASCNLSHTEQKAAKAAGSEDPGKMAAVDKKKDSIEGKLKKLAMLDEMDRDDAASAGTPTPAPKKQTSTMMIMMIVLVLLCCCGGIAAIVMMKK